MKKLILTALFGLVAQMFIVSSSYAADSSSGCGIGWQVLPKQSLVSSFTRNLVNATFSNTIAMTLGTSGCAKHSIVYNEKQGLHFVEANKEVLVAEMALGNGEYLTAMAEVFGCQDSSSFATIVKENYQTLVPSYEISGVELYQNIKNNSEVMSQCSVM